MTVLNAEHRERLLTKLRREMGTVILDALADPAVLEVMLNPDGQLWIERFGHGKQCVGEFSSSQADAMVATIAAFMDTTVTYERPTLEAELPLDGSRFTALIAPVVARPTFTIRKRASRVFTLDDYASAGIMTAEQAQTIKDAVSARRNVIVAGSTGSGKTTLLNAVLHAISERAPHDRLVLIEDTGELQCSAPDTVTLRAVGHYTMNQCLKSTMRLRPDRIVVGEVRGGEAMALLKSWNTGHEGGASTIHASSARLALSRLQSLIAEAPEAANYTPAMVAGLIAEAVHVVVFIGKDVSAKAGRRVREVVVVEGIEPGSGDYRVRAL